MSSIRLIPLGAPLAASMWLGGDLAVAALSAVAVLLLLLVGRSVRHRLERTGIEPDDRGSS